MRWHISLFCACFECGMSTQTISKVTLRQLFFGVEVCLWNGAGLVENASKDTLHTVQGICFYVQDLLVAGSYSMCWSLAVDLSFVQHQHLDPRQLMAEILSEIHYMPDHWKERPHTIQVFDALPFDLIPPRGFNVQLRLFLSRFTANLHRCSSSRL